MQADAAHPNPEVARRLSHIYGLHRTDIDLRLGGSPYLALLEKLGNPHLRLPPVVHVAGTNGKGSVLAFLRAILEAAGYRVHAYTSPHLLRFNERIRIAGTLISDDRLVALYDRVLDTNAGAPITFFEFTTAMAFLAFAEIPADIVLLETGMGGRLDCTNVVDRPVATAITKISLDHTEFLGGTLQEIAAEKAGIMKPGTPCVIGAQMDPAAVIPVFENAAKKTGADLIFASERPQEGWPSPNLAGAHQLENAATALALSTLLERSNFTLTDAHRRHGLTHADWPGRLQRISGGPVASLLPPGWELWFDAAHNDSGALALGTQLGTWRAENAGSPVHLMVGLAADKDAGAFFAPLAGLYESLTLIDLRDARKPQLAQDLKARIAHPVTACAPSVYEALKVFDFKRKNSGKICVAGSLYLYQTLINFPKL